MSLEKSIVEKWDIKEIKSLAEWYTHSMFKLGNCVLDIARAILEHYESMEAWEEKEKYLRETSWILRMSDLILDFFTSILEWE